MNGIKKDVKIMIESQQKIICEVMDMKVRIEILESKETIKVDDDLKHQFECFQEELKIEIEKIDNSIKELDAKIDDFNKKKAGKESIEVKQCAYDRRGFCRARLNCKYFHSPEICDEFVAVGVCLQEVCRKRHPLMCHRVFENECEWGMDCKYLHREKIVEAIKNHEMETNDKTNPDSIDISNSEADMIKVSKKDVHDDDTFGDNEEYNDDSEVETIEAIMAKAMAFEELNDEDHDETIDAIMAKARAFVFEDSD